MNKIKSLLENKKIYYLAITSFLFGLLFLVYQYSLLTNFPIGDDPAVHIQTVKSLSYQQIWQTNRYPLPINIFKFLHNLTNIPYPHLFTLLIPTYFLLAVIALGLLIYPIKKNILIPFCATILFATARWSYDGLRMGLLAEVFGWAILLFALVGLSRKNLWLTLLASFLLIFSHPISFTIYGIIFSLYLLCCLPDKKERRFPLIIAGVYLLSVLTVYLAKPTLLNSFLNFINFESETWGVRPLLDVISGEARYRFLIPLVSLIGIIISIKNWRLPIIKISYLLLLTGLFMSFNNRFGIGFLVFRFFPYLEMGMIIFAAIGLHYLITDLKYSKNISLILTIVFALILAAPNFFINHRGIKFQVNDPQAQAIMLPEDRAAIQWFKGHTDPASSIATDRRHAIWLTALSDHSNFDYQTAYFDQKQLNTITDLNTLPAQYIYYPANSDIPPGINTVYQTVYQNNHVTIKAKK